MKTPEEYLRENGISMIDYNHSADYPSAVKAIKKAQEEAYQQGYIDGIREAQPPIESVNNCIITDSDGKRLIEGQDYKIVPIY